MRKMTRCMILIGQAGALALGPWLIAQDVPPATAPTTQPAAPATQEATGVLTAPPAPNGQTVEVMRPSTTARAPTTQISLNFKEAPIDAVLEHLSEVAGFVIVKESPLSGRVTVLSKQPVSPEEAVTLLNAVLKVNGFTAVQMGRILKITTRDKAKKSSIPVYFGSDPKNIPESDDLITQVIPVRSVDAVKLKVDLQPLIGTEADVSSNAGSNSIVITDTAANIRRIVTIIANMDKRDAMENTIKVRQLKYADATSAARLITDIFKSEDQQGQNQQGGPAQFFRAMQGGGNRGGNNPNQPDEDKGRTGRILASADSRTNSVVVTGPADTLKIIDDMLTQLDNNPASEAAFFLYPLKNAQAANLSSTLNNLFGNGSTSTSSQRTNNNAALGSSRQNTNRNTGATGNTGFGGGTGSRNTGGAAGSTNTGIGQGQAINRAFNQGAGTGQAGGNTARAASELTGEVYVVADADTNSLLINTATKYQDQVRKIIEELDRPVPQVLIKVLIAEVSHNNTSDFGLDFSILNLRNGTNSGQSYSTSFGAPTNGLIINLLETNVTATLHALATAGKLDVLSRPYILASDNQEASITVGQTVPIITDSRLDVNNNAVNQISYKDIGIILNVTPHINPDGLVIMDVAPQVSSFSDQTVPISSTVNAPVFNLRSADSRVGIRDGETIVIGGMMDDRKTETVQKVPILGDIPFVGLAFQRKQVTKTKTELLFFLTPHVAKSPQQLKPMSQDETNGLKLVPNAVQPGVYDEHQRGLQRGGTTQPASQQPTDGRLIEPTRGRGERLEAPLPGEQRDR